MEVRRADARKFDLADSSQALGSALFGRAQSQRAIPSASSSKVAPTAWATRTRSDEALRRLVQAIRSGDIPEARHLVRALQASWDARAQVFRDSVAPANKDEALIEEHRARAVWALGIASGEAADPQIRHSARALYQQVLPTVVSAEGPRAMALAMVGAAAFLRSAPGHEQSAAMLEQGGAMFHHLLAPERRPAWTWFEAVLGSDYALLPQALIEAGETLARPDWRETGREALAWVARHDRAEEPLAI